MTSGSPPKSAVAAARHRRGISQAQLGCRLLLPSHYIRVLEMTSATMDPVSITAVNAVIEKTDVAHDG